MAPGQRHRLVCDRRPALRSWPRHFSSCVTSDELWISSELHLEALVRVKLQSEGSPGKPYLERGSTLKTFTYPQPNPWATHRPSPLQNARLSEGSTVHLETQASPFTPLCPRFPKAVQEPVLQAPLLPGVFLTGPFRALSVQFHPTGWLEPWTAAGIVKWHSPRGDCWHFLNTNTQFP